MVEVLKACTQNHAPLSQAQTVKVFQYLEDMNKDTHRQIQEVKRVMEMSSSGTGDFKMDMRSLTAQIFTAQQELVTTNTRISAFRVDVLGNAANVVVLQEQTAKATEGLNQILEGQKITNTNVHSLREDHLAAKEEIRRLQKEVYSLKEAKENVLQAKLDHAILAMQQCKEDLAANKVKTYQNEDSCRELLEAQSALKADFGKINIVSAEHSKRMEELRFKGEKLKENLELTNGVVMRIHSEHEETRINVLDNAKIKHEVKVALQRLKDDHGHTANTVNIVNEGLSKLRAGQDTMRDNLAETNIRVGGVNSSAVGLQNAVHEISKSLELVHTIASNTEDNLKKTNAMVLPNLGAEGAFSVGATGFSGSTDLGSTVPPSAHNAARSSPRNRGSPRKQKDAAWFSRNIGSVPDRMSWI